MRGQIAVGDLPRAESRYATARVQLGQIRPVVEPRSLSGFREIERAIFGQQTTTGLKRSTARLQAEAEDLRRRLADMPLRPQQLVAGAAATVDRVLTFGLKGAEEPLSRLDLVDIAAEIEGAQAAMEAVEAGPGGHREAGELKEAFSRVYNALKPYGFAAREPQSRPAAAGARFVDFSEVSTEQRREISLPVERLVRLLQKLQRSVPATTG